MRDTTEPTATDWAAGFGVMFGLVLIAVATCWAAGVL